MTGPPALEEKPVPLALKATAVAYLIVIAVCAWAFRSRLSADFWPVDASRVSPNILATVIQILFWAPIAYLAWPPTRRRIHRWMTSHTAPLHASLDRLHEQRERHHAEQMQKLGEIHAHLQDARGKR